MKHLLKGSAALALALAATTASAETVLTISSWAGPNHSMNSVTFPYIADTLSECSGGDLTAKIEFGLAPPPAQYDTIRDGVADMGWIVHGYTPGKFVTTKLAELPGIPGNAEQMSVAFQMTAEKYLDAAGEAKGVEVLANFTHGPGLLNTVDELSDGYKSIDGMKLRVGGGVANMVGTALGVAGVNVPAPAVYETIASGVAEGVFFPAESLYAFKTAELTKFSYVNPDGMYTTSFGLLMNKDTYDGLSDANKKCVDDMRGVELARTIGQHWDAADDFGREKAQAEFGLNVIELDDAQRSYFKEKTAGIEAAVLEEISATGVDGAAALEYLKSQIK
ncbi:TRAP transporter substrate-binding protein [Sulfitobacter aestuariivivens]|uniref:TRAP transporter substrate-binding protein n=1 Tax=Sulfitobacter aestuariivivens TaxID=2766981 RepID=A0A927DAA7_9RHOB|nr:TRAP transporter substrate-binding protein [Sulfitobacter aestuariivivens]MBD3666072.1 TRAP transporter substrate-binding protein [Sulfitobacter aestuariivivens]